MKEQRISEILARIKNVKVAVYGDFCVDAYWLLDPCGSEVSLETGLQAQAVARHYYSLGGASNVVANLAALRPASIQVIGVVGDDIFGRELARQLKELGVDTTYLVVQKDNFDTVTFGKPYLEGNELPRMDFGFFNKRTEATDQALLNGIKNALQTADALIFNQQVPGSITNESFIDSANALFGKFRDKIVLLDSRHYGCKFRDIYRKTNDLEAAQLNNVDVKLDDVLTLADVKKYAGNLYRQFSKPVFLTRGSRGIITIDSDGYHEVPGIQLLKKLDIVGAGDTVTSALALCLGADLPPAPEGAFSIVVIPDTQQYRGRGTKAEPESQAPLTNAVFEAYVEWTVSNLDRQRIVFVSHVGDIVDINNRDQWAVARRCMDRLHGRVRYGISVGNHDMTGDGDSSLFQELLHQYTLSQVAYAAVPQLVDIA